MRKRAEISILQFLAYASAITAVLALLVAAIFGPSNVSWFWAIVAGAAAVLTAVFFAVIAFQSKQQPTSQAEINNSGQVPV